MLANSLLPIGEQRRSTSSSYRTLLGEKAWASLRNSIRERFAKPTEKTIEYIGVMQHMRLSIMGRLFANFCRLLGTPLAPYAEQNVDMLVKVYPHKRLRGLTWERHYFFKHHDRIIAKSTKCINEDTGLMEIVDSGLGMDLKITAEQGALHFRSTRYFLQ